VFVYTPADRFADYLLDASSYQKDKEDVYAAYGQYQFGFGRLGIIAGARVENTRATYAANLVDSLSVVPSVTPVSQDKTYTNFFPTAQARYEFMPDLIGRAAVSSTIARPGFNQVTASTSIDPGGSVSTGNPQLKPTTATGIDLSIDKYLPHAGVASLGVFDKEINDYIVTRRRIYRVPIKGIRRAGEDFHLYQCIEIASLRRRDQLRAALSRPAAGRLGRFGRIRQLDLGAIPI